MRIFLFFTVSTLVLLGACGAPIAPPQSALPIATAGSIEISEPRVRLPSEGRNQTAAYMTLTNRGTKTDSLVSATSIGATKLELHAHIKTQDGLMAMREINRIEVPAGATIPLSPGGYHIMVKQLTKNLKTGNTLPIDLSFASGAKASLALPVVDNPRSQTNGKHDEDVGGHKH
jgi:periplasmic copper chaperone A